MNLYSTNICNLRTQYGMALQRLAQTANKGYCISGFLVYCSFCVTSMPALRVFSAWTCVCFANNKIF